MKGIEYISPDRILVLVDTRIYTETVISKVLYHLAGDFAILRSKEAEEEEKITFQSKNGVIKDNEFQRLKETISQLFIDFNMRQIVTEETKNIRDILYIKAFAHGEEFEDHYLSE